MPPQRKATEIGANELNNLIRRRRLAIATYLRQWRLFDALRGDQQDKLTDLVLRHDAAFRQFRWFSQADSERSQAEAAGQLTNRDLRADEKDGGAQRRVFSRKISRAVEAIDDALEYATDASKTPVYARTLRSFAVPKLVAVKDSLTDLAEWNDLLVPATPIRIADPRPEATETLLTFFAHECGLTDTDARRQTAKIFTGFRWRGAQTKGEKPSAGIRRETEAVRKRHARAKRRR